LVFSLYDYKTLEGFIRGAGGEAAIWQVYYFLCCQGLFVYKYVTFS